jgi:hypothetical protein
MIHGGVAASETPTGTQFAAERPTGVKPAALPSVRSRASGGLDGLLQVRNREHGEL